MIHTTLYVKHDVNYLRKINEHAPFQVPMMERYMAKLAEEMGI